MIDLEYSRYITELLMDNELNEKLRSRRFDALRKMRELRRSMKKKSFCRNWLRRYSVKRLISS